MIKCSYYDETQWQLVPKVATEEMIDVLTKYRGGPEEAYQAMLAAAPEPPAVDGDELASLLPGTYYMDPPDGGSVTLLEQLQRMAKDARRYRWLRDNGEQAISDDRGAGPEWTYGNGLDDLVDAAMAASKGDE